MTQSTGMALDLSANGGGEEIITGLPSPTDMGISTDADNHIITDPEAINRLAKTLDVEQPEDDPVIGPVPDGTVTLLAGYVDAEGTRHTDVEIRELRGRDEETMAKAIATGDTGRFIDSVVRAGVTRIGTVEDPKAIVTALDSLLVGDRALLVMEIRRMAYGDTMELSVTCPMCTHQFDIMYSFRNDVPIKPYEPEGGDLSSRMHTVTMPSGAMVRIRALDGAGQKKVFTPGNLRDLNDEQRNTLVLAELVDSINGKSVLGTAQILDQTSRDRRALLKWVVDQPGPDYAGVMQDCPNCDREFVLGEVDMYQMFRGA